MDLLGIAGTIGTFAFGFISLYQWTALTALKKAIRGHTQTAFNNFWSVGNEMEQATRVDLPPDVLARCSRANATSMAARHEVINFGREYAGFVPQYEKGWSPDPIH